MLIMKVCAFITEYHSSYFNSAALYLDQGYFSWLGFDLHRGFKGKHATSNEDIAWHAFFFKTSIEAVKCKRSFLKKPQSILNYLDRGINYYAGLIRKKMPGVRVPHVSIAKKKIETCNRTLAIKFQVCGGVCSNILFPPKDVSHLCSLFHLTCYFDDQSFVIALSSF